MTAPVVVPERPQGVTVPNPGELTEQSRAFAEPIFSAVAEQYLEFRRIYYHEDHPSLSTAPPSHAEVRQAEIARLAESTLHLLPQAVKSIPVVGGFLDHLQQVANIHSISERERLALHNMTMAFLYGIRGGIQPWYVAWLLAAAHNLAEVTHPQYYMAFPWDALLYKGPAVLAAFDGAVRQGNIAAIEREIEQLGSRLITVLRDPVGSQPELAFTGPDAERRKTLFNLKTGAALALGAYLVAEEARALSIRAKTGRRPSPRWRRCPPS
jgi:hypothetical protein